MTEPQDKPRQHLFRFVGAFDALTGTANVFGQTVKSGEIFELPGDRAAKADNNRFFERVTQAQETERGDDDPLLKMERDDLIALAEKKDVKIDKRWGTEKIIEAIKA
jgi:hypothetical protein